MKSLLEFLIEKITGAKAENEFVVTETREADRTTLTVAAKPNIIGLIIGKEGRTIKNIRKIVAVRAVLEKTSVNISVTEQ
jgi:predicted RNA-binding protein YlqC (UPF0109 family)